jgi:protein phosphatase
MIRTDVAPLKVSWSGRTHPGRYRTDNEDAFLMLTFDSREVHRLGKDGSGLFTDVDYVFAVSDGMGGGGAGDLASRFAIDKIAEILPHSFRSSAKGLPPGFPDNLSTVFERIHNSLTYIGSGYEECRGIGATLSLLWLSPTKGYFGHVGDSRVYHLPAAGGLLQITHDDTHVGWLRRQGQINEREHRTHPRRTSLQRSLGGGFQFVDPQLGSISFERGDRFVICSDGLVDGLWDRHIEEMARAVPLDTIEQGAAEALIRAANENSGRDNTTLIVVGVQ